MAREKIPVYVEYSFNRTLVYFFRWVRYLDMETGLRKLSKGGTYPADRRDSPGCLQVGERRFT